jgi:hypothetical protein
MSSLKSFIQRIRPGPRFIDPFRNMLAFYDEGLVAPRPTPKLEDHPLSFSAAAYSIYSQLPSNSRGRPFPPQLEDAPCCGDKGDPPDMVKRNECNTKTKEGKKQVKLFPYQSWRPVRLRYVEDPTLSRKSFHG